jgi:hypothetical protein
MCLFNPKPQQQATPSMPEAPPPPPIAITPATPTTVKPAVSKKQSLMGAKKGASLLQIPLSTGGASPSGAVNLNIGK